MADDSGFFDRLRSRGHEVLTQVSAELGQNPRFQQAVAGAVRGKEKIEEAAARALRQMNVPTRSELKRALARIDALEKEVRTLKRSRNTAAAGRRSAAGRGRRKAAR